RSERRFESEVVALLAVQAPVESDQLLLFAHAQADKQVNDFEDDERACERDADGDADGDELVEDLRAVAVNESYGEDVARRVFEDRVDGARGEDAREQ